MVDKIVTHSKYVLTIAKQQGWMVGARYTNIRDVKHLKKIHFIDIDWKNYHFSQHIDAVKKYRPKYTVAKDIECITELNQVLKQAELLEEFSQNVILVPKCQILGKKIKSKIPEKYILGYSVPTKYGGTRIDIKYFFNRRIHLLGGRPEIQREIANRLQVVSIDCNRFTLDARYGDFFNGIRFVPHPIGGYGLCIEESIRNINQIWNDYGKCR